MRRTLRGLVVPIGVSALVCFSTLGQAPQRPTDVWAVHSYATTPQRIVYTAARSLGLLRGIEERDYLETIIYHGTGTAYKPGPAADWSAVKLDNYSAEVNYYAQGIRVDTLSEGHRRVEVAAGKYAWDENDVSMDGPPIGTSQTSLPAMEQQRRRELAMLPYSAIKLAHQNIDKVTVTPLEHGTYMLSFPYAGDTMKVTLDRNRRPAKVELGINDRVLGKTTVSAEYSDYKDYEGRGVSEMYFPSRIIQKIGSHTLLDLQVSQCKCVNPYVIFPIPESIGQGQP